MEHDLEILLGVLTGLGLAAACGFRVFVPLFVAALGVRAGMLEVGDGFEWLGSTAALVSLGSATVLEIAAYYVPVVDNFLDTVATPAAAVAGALVSAAMIQDVDPWLRWTLAVVAGGGVATAVQTASVVTRGASTVTTAGLANPAVATGELAGAATFSGLALLAPVLGILLLASGGLWLVSRRVRRQRGEHKAEALLAERRERLARLVPVERPAQLRG
jgi:hypothetical protein